MSSSDNINVPETGKRVELSSLDVQVSPPRVDFGLGTHQAPVDTLMKQELVLRNTLSQDVLVLVAPIDDPKNSYRFRVKVSHPQAFVVKAGTEERVVVHMKVLCTTSLKLELSVKTWLSEGVEFKEAVIQFCTESELSPKLDPDELVKGDWIGCDSFFIVFKGVYRGRSVAILDYKSPSDDRYLRIKEFENQVRMMENIRHPAIVGFVGAVHDPGKLAIVEDYCRYGTLSDAMRNHPEAFTDRLKVKCLLDCSSAMLFLHRSGCVHRDLKPHNILMTSLNPDSEVCAKLTGFHCARDWNQSQLMVTMVGTPLFTAPEIMQARPYDNSVDVYSFALVMYFVFSGRVPFQDDPESDALLSFAHAVVAGKRPEIPASCPPKISDLIQKCWSGEPSERPSFEVVCNTLKEFFDQLGKENEEAMK